MKRDDATPKQTGVQQVAPIKFSKSSHLIGMGILLSISLSIVGSSFVTQTLQRPFFCTYLNNSFSIVYLLAYLSKSCIPLRPTFRSSSVRRPRREVVDSTVSAALMFVPLILAMSASFNWSLDHTSMSNNSIISASSSLFAMLFSWFMMRSPIRSINLLGASLIIVGVALVSWISESSDAMLLNSLAGDAAAMLSAILSGFYTSLLSKRIPDGSPVDMTLFFGFIGLLILVGFGPCIFLLNYFGLEAIPTNISSQAVLLLLVNAALTISANLMWAKAIQLTSPFVASIGLGLTTPLTMLADFVVHDKRFGIIYCTGGLLVVAGYIITNLQYHHECEGSNTPSAVPPASARRQSESTSFKGAIINET